MRWLVCWLLVGAQFSSVLAFGTYAATVFQQEIRSTGIVSAARYVARQPNPVSAPKTTTDAISKRLKDFDGSCSRIANRARVSAALFLLDHAIASNGTYEKRLEAMHLARSSTRHSLRCGPLDGDHWLRLALIESNAAFELERIQKLLGLAIATTPYEGPLMENRMMVLAEMPGRHLLARQHATRVDFCRFIRFARSGVVKRVLGSLGHQRSSEMRRNCKILQ